MGQMPAEPSKIEKQREHTPQGSAAEEASVVPAGAGGATGLLLGLQQTQGNARVARFL